MNKRKMVGLAILTGVLLGTTGCASVPDEKQMISDLQNYAGEDLLSGGEELVSLTIEERKTEKKEKMDAVWCTAVTEKEDISYKKEVTINYYLDKKGWIYQNAVVEDERSWIVEPLKGVNEKEIAESLIGERIKLEADENWHIVDGELASVTIKQQKTDLEGKKDEVLAEIVLDGEVETVKGTVSLDYGFDREWKLQSMVTDQVETEMIAGKDLEISEKVLLNELDGYTFLYGGSDYVYKQEITIEQEEVSDLVIDSHRKTEKGKKQEIEYHCVYHTERVAFDLNVKVCYLYQGEWTKQYLDVEAEAKSVDLLGTWSGRYSDAPYKGNSVLEITEVDGDHIQAVYYYKPDVISKFSEAGSYYVAGTIDRKTLLFRLEAGDWLEMPNRVTLEKQDIIATFYVDKDVIEGKAQFGKWFQAAKED